MLLFVGIKMNSFCAPANCSFVRCPGNTASVLYEQHTSNLNDLFDKHTPVLLLKVLLNDIQILIC